MTDPYFIKQATSANPGGLHRSLGVPTGQTIPRPRVQAAAKQPGRVGQQARLALTLESLNKGSRKKPRPMGGGDILARAASGR